jgi:pilus assembly protein Flp/PilA
MYFAPDETGQGLVEYALIIAFIAILLIAALGFISGGLNRIYSNIASNL